MPQISGQEKLRRRQKNGSVLGTHAMSGLYPDAQTLRLMDRYADGELTMDEFSAALDAHARNLVVEVRERKVPRHEPVEPYWLGAEVAWLPELFWDVRQAAIAMRESGYPQSAEALFRLQTSSRHSGEIFEAAETLLSRLSAERIWSQSVTMKLSVALVFARSIYPVLTTAEPPPVLIQLPGYYTNA